MRTVTQRLVGTSGSMLPLSFGLALLVGLLSLGGMAWGDTFNCGSDGSDGALTYPVRDGSPYEVDFVAKDLGINADGDAVYNFTTINIPANVTVNFPADKSGWAPLYWLASGDVIISGTLDLIGAKGHDNSDSVPGKPSMPGSGGYPGGWGGSSVIGTYAHNGFGPRGYSWGCAYFMDDTNALPQGVHPGSYYLFPLTGGSGGAGGVGSSPSSGGGAGGGALLLASNTMISVNGALLSDGGGAGDDVLSTGNCGVLGWGGAGGAFRLVTPTINGNGLISSKAGDSNDCMLQWHGSSESEDGWIRIESDQDNYTGSIICSRFRRVPLIESAVYGLPNSVDTGIPSARVTKIGGVSLPEVPGGSFTVPDVVLNTSEPVLFEIEAENIPVGTTFKIQLFNETTYASEETSYPLVGTAALSSATASITIPNGNTWGYVYATFTR